MVVVVGAAEAVRQQSLEVEVIAVMVRVAIEVVEAATETTVKTAVEGREAVRVATEAVEAAAETTVKTAADGREAVKEGTGEAEEVKAAEERAAEGREVAEGREKVKRS